MFNIKFLIKLSFQLLILAGISLTSCKKHRAKTHQKVDSLIVADTIVKVKVDSSVIMNKADSVESEVDAIKVDEIDFKYFSSTSKLRYKTATENQNAQINFRIKKDSLIWFSISGFGIEAVRGIITSDSLFAIDKLHREYYKFDFASLSQNFNFDLNFDVLQSLVLGNMPIKKVGKNKFVKKENDYYLLHQEEGKVMIDNYIGQQNRKLKKLQLSNDDNSENKLTMTFDDFQMINEHVFPYQSLLTLGYQSQKDQKFYETLIELKHKKVEFSEEPLGFPFSIPANYSPKN
jgi:Domain of unknown function (DUF4292)